MDADSPLLELGYYIHLNLVRAALLQTLEQYPGAGTEHSLARCGRLAGDLLEPAVWFGFLLCVICSRVCASSSPAPAVPSAVLPCREYGGWPRGQSPQARATVPRPSALASRRNEPDVPGKAHGSAGPAVGQQPGFLCPCCPTVSSKPLNAAEV